MPFKINLEIKEEHKDNTIAQLKAKVAELEAQLQIYTGQLVTSGFSWTPSVTYPTTPSIGTGISINTNPYTINSTTQTGYNMYMSQLTNRPRIKPNKQKSTCKVGLLQTF